MQLDEMVRALMDKIEAWFVGLGAMIPNLVVAILVFIVALWVARLAEKVARRGLRRVVHTPELVALASTLARVALVVSGLFVALSVLELDKAVTSMLAGVGLLGLALGFAFQDIAATFVSGMAIEAAFDEAGITIPFPIRTLEFGSGGPESLGQAIAGDG